MRDHIDPKFLFSFLYFLIILIRSLLLKSGHSFFKKKRVYFKNKIWNNNYGYNLTVEDSLVNIYQAGARNIFLKIDIEKYKRIDLQLIAMIDDARGRLLKENNQNINEKVITVGFSSSSLFAARFTFLHPDRVSVAIGGGIGGLLPVPAEKINGIDVIYPIGTYDFEKITGNKLDL